MAVSKQIPGNISGARAVYVVAAELSRQGWIASVTARNAKGADILVTDELCKKTFSVQVKSARSRSTWLVGKDAPVSNSHVFVFVGFQEKREPEFYVVPSRKIESLQANKGSDMPYVRKGDLDKFKNKWPRLP